MHESTCLPAIPDAIEPASLAMAANGTNSPPAAPVAAAVDAAEFTPEYRPHAGEVLDEAKRAAIVTMLMVGCSRRMGRPAG